MSKLIFACELLHKRNFQSRKFFEFMYAWLIRLLRLNVCEKPTVCKRWYQFENHFKFIHPPVEWDWRKRERKKTLRAWVSEPHYDYKIQTEKRTFSLGKNDFFVVLSESVTRICSVFKSVLQKPRFFIIFYCSVEKTIFLTFLPHNRAF